MNSEVVMDLVAFEDYLYSRGLSTRTIYTILNRTKLLQKNAFPLTTESFNSFLSSLRKSGKGAACINKYIQTLRHIGMYQGFTWWENYKLFTENPQQKNCLGIEEIKTFLNLPPFSNQSPENYRKWRLFWSLCAYTGLRIGNIASMEVEQIQFDTSKIIIPDEKAKTTFLEFPLLEVLVEPLQEHMRTLKGEFLFPSYSDPNHPMTETSYRKEFRRRIEVMAVKRYINPYNFRHSAINRWRKAKIDVKDVKSLVGHKKISTTEWYFLQPDIDELKKVVEHNDPLLSERLNPYEFLEKFKQIIFGFNLQNDQRYIWSFKSSERGFSFDVQIR